MRLTVTRPAKATAALVTIPATVGGIKAGCFKIGNTGGTIENIIESKLHRPGSVGFVSKSGGLSNEAYYTIAMNTDGLYEGIAIGGDMYPGSTLLEHLLRYEKIPEVKMLVCLGEVLSGVVNFFNPHAVFLTGSLSSSEPFIAAVRSRVYEGCHPLVTRDLRIEAAQTGPDAILFGAARLVLETVPFATPVTAR